MSKTVYLLFAQHEKAVLPLEDICEEYFDMNRKTAYQHAATQSLPVPVFRARDSERCRWMVSIEELAKHIDKCRADAQALHSKMRAA